MLTRRQLGTVFTATTSVILLNWLYLLDIPPNYLFKQSSTAKANELLKSEPQKGRDELGSPKGTSVTGGQARPESNNDDNPGSPKGGTIGSGSRMRYESDDGVDVSPPSSGIGSPQRIVPPLPRNATPRRKVAPRCQNDSQSAPVSLTLLVPEKHRGLTASGRPTFVWYLSDVPGVPMRFSLTDPEGKTTFIDQKIEAPQAGINKLEMPKDKPELVSGQTYRWTLSLVCNKRQASPNVARATIKRVDAPQKLQEQLAGKTLESDKAIIYARAGYWYDALAASLAARAANPNDAAVRDDFLSLLDQVGLNEITKQQRSQLTR
ncbi:DUF928 domain-containing protein [Microcoleus sp. FACHB-831]|uniref:DUF928 domain-containing protein n=1 Tax=Microcoleus sp. FACHB-831 TaxID=2692827 RepID=UPI0016843F0D|nr:DUF928 domain-containing protein [Microcoleus sp. FACHB-831]MBD1921869.1 DUF928 domain-containing protein [Microcoleus sp. FACHB-831]